MVARRKTTLAACAAAVGVVAACGASAAAPVHVSLVRPLAGATVGKQWNARLAVRPASFRGSLRVTASGPGRVATRVTGARGSYRARLVFPKAGRWLLTAQAGGSTSRLGPITVKAAPTAPLVLSEPTSIELEPSGTLLVVESAFSRVLRVDPAAAAVGVVASGLPRPYAVARTPSGAILVSAGNALLRLDGATPTTVANSGDGIGPLTAGPGADVHFASETHVFRLAGGSGTPVAVAGTGVEGGGGDGGPATAAQVAGPHGLGIAADGALLVADTRNNRLRRIDPATGVITMLAAIGSPFGIDVAADGTIYVVDGTASRVVHLTPAGTRIGLVGPAFRTPYDVEGAPDGTVYLLEAGPSGRIKRIAADGTVTTVSRR